jgi:hypothetical protein
MRPPKLPAIRASFRTHHVVTLGERDFKRRSARAGLGWSTQRQFDNAAKQASPFARKLFDLRLRRLYLSADRGQLTPRAVTGCRSQWRASEHKYDNLRIRIAKILLSHQWIWSSDGGDHAPPRCIFQLAAPHARVRLRASDLVSLGGHHVVTTTITIDARANVEKNFRSFINSLYGERGGNRTHDPLIKSKTPAPQQRARTGQLLGSAGHRPIATSLNTCNSI